MEKDLENVLVSSLMKIADSLGACLEFIYFYFFFWFRRFVSG